MGPALTGALSRVWILQGLSEEELTHLSRLARTRVYKPREIIVRKGEPADQFFVLLRGRAKVGTPLADGSDATINVLGPGEVFGEIAILDGRPRSATVTTLEECEMAVVDKPAFNGLLASSPSIAVKLLSVLAGRVRDLTTRIEDRAFLDVPARLAKQLLWLATHHGNSSGSAVRIDLRLSQQELGNLVGATRESVNKQLREWTRSGILRQERDSIELFDLDALRAVAESHRSAG
ncbi:MAG TPA: Crp/Fnr family transcriptional regulator [Burkholderiales bacterium]|nr:Crp/Fnr family transcriptional regulator [Burkholderiales bacterium]